MKSEIIRVRTGARDTVADITDECADFVRTASGGGDGLLHVFVPHATAGIAVLEVGSGSDADLLSALASDVPPEWETLLRLTAVVMGQPADADIAALDAFVADDIARRAGLSADVSDRVGPERLVDLMLRSGPYDVTLADLEAAPNGVDLGPLALRLPGALTTASGRIELAPEPIVRDVPRLAALLATAPEADRMVRVAEPLGPVREVRDGPRTFSRGRPPRRPCRRASSG